VQSKSKVALNEFLFPSACAIVFKSANQTLADLANTRHPTTINTRSQSLGKIAKCLQFQFVHIFLSFSCYFSFWGVQLGLTDFRILKSQQTSTPLNSSNPKLGRLALSTLSYRKNLPIIKTKFI